MKYLKNLGLSIVIAVVFTALGAIAFHTMKDVYEWWFEVDRIAAGIVGIFILEVGIAFLVFTAIDWDKKDKQE